MIMFLMISDFKYLLTQSLKSYCTGNLSGKLKISSV